MNETISSLFTYRQTAELARKHARSQALQSMGALARLDETADRHSVEILASLAKAMGDWHNAPLAEPFYRIARRIQIRSESFQQPVAALLAQVFGPLAPSFAAGNPEDSFAALANDQARWLVHPKRADERPDVEKQNFCEKVALCALLAAGEEEEDQARIAFRKWNEVSHANTQIFAVVGVSRARRCLVFEPLLQERTIDRIVLHAEKAAQFDPLEALFALRAARPFLEKNPRQAAAAAERWNRILEGHRERLAAQFKRFPTCARVLGLS